MIVMRCAGWTALQRILVPYHARTPKCFAVNVPLLPSSSTSLLYHRSPHLLLSTITITITITFPAPPSSPSPVFSGKERCFLAIYVSLGGLVGLLLPLLQIIQSLIIGESNAIAVTAPHLFLLSAQIFLEGISLGYDFSLPARAAVPIIYNTKRLFTIADWVRHEVGGGVSVGCVIALANTVFWGFNLLGFLLPVYLPRALKLYYCDEGSYKSSTRAR